jgi:hypothetical protein
MNYQLTSDEPALQKMVNAYEQGHDWQYSRCAAHAACRICVPRVQGKPLIGSCQQQHHLGIPETEREVLA